MWPNSVFLVISALYSASQGDTHPIFGIDAKGPCIFGKGLLALSIDLSQACSGICLLYLEASAFFQPCLRSVLLCCCHITGAGGSFPGVPLEIRLRSSSPPYPHAWKVMESVLFSLEFCLKGKGKSPCTESHFYFFILPPQLKKFLSSSPNLRSPHFFVPWFLCDSATLGAMPASCHRVEEVNTFKGKIT